MEYISYYHSPFGAITLASDGASLTGLWFDTQKPSRAFLTGQYTEKDLPVLRQAKTWLSVYFGGKDPGFTPPLALQGTAFRQEVWKLLLLIPYGETVSYGEIAKKIAAQRGLCAMSAQAVGGAVGHNPVSLIVPCHRVIGKDGSLTGYGGGIPLKKRLLALEQQGQSL